jgi:hypothetical protein
MLEVVMMFYYLGTNYMTIAPLSPRGRLRKSVSAIGVEDLLIVKNASRTSQEENSCSHVSIFAGTASRVRHFRLNLALVILVRFAGCHLEIVSIE